VYMPVNLDGLLTILPGDVYLSAHLAYTPSLLIGLAHCTAPLASMQIMILGIVLHSVTPLTVTTAIIKHGLAILFVLLFLISTPIIIQNYALWAVLEGISLIMPPELVF
jgi:hypothetical protein